MEEMNKYGVCMLYKYSLVEEKSSVSCKPVDCECLSWVWTHFEIVLHYYRNNSAFKIQLIIFGLLRVFFKCNRAFKNENFQYPFVAFVKQKPGTLVWLLGICVNAFASILIQNFQVLLDPKGRETVYRTRRRELEQRNSAFCNALHCNLYVDMNTVY